MVPGETIAVLKEAVLEMNVGRNDLKMWLFFTEMRDELIPRLGFPPASDASVDLKCHMLRLDRE
jgi:hypothetical protein